MADTDIQSLDLRSFRMLLAVAQVGSFTRAADTLKLSQSVVSYNVDKLRQAFDDPLFVRIAGQMRPTERCQAIIDFAERMFDDIDLLRAAQHFNPTTAEDRVVIACNYYERTLIVPPVVAALTKAAPHLKVEIVDASGTGHEKLMNREADLLIGPFQRDDAAFYGRALVTDDYSCLMDPAHPMAQLPLTLERYLQLDHVVVTYGRRWRSSYLSTLDQNKMSLREALHIPSPAGIEELVRDSRLVATLPTLLARKVGAGLTLCPCPVDATLPIKLVWTIEKHNSPMLAWVRDMIGSVARKLPAASR